MLGLDNADCSQCVLAAIIHCRDAESSLRQVPRASSRRLARLTSGAFPINKPRRYMHTKLHGAGLQSTRLWDVSRSYFDAQ